MVFLWTSSPTNICFMYFHRITFFFVFGLSYLLISLLEAHKITLKPILKRLGNPKRITFTIRDDYIIVDKFSDK